MLSSLVALAALAVANARTVPPAYSTRLENDRVTIAWTYEHPAQHAVHGWEVLSMSRPEKIHVRMMAQVARSEIGTHNLLRELPSPASLLPAAADEDGVRDDETIAFRVLLHRDADVAERLARELDEISIPNHPAGRFGKYHTQASLRKIVRGDGQREHRAIAWLASHGITNVQSHGDALTVRAPAAAVQRAFDCSLHRFAHVSSPSRKLVRALGHVSIPQWLASDVSFVAGLTEFWRPTKHGARNTLTTFAPGGGAIRGDGTGAIGPRKQQGLKAASCAGCPLMTPQSLRQYYNISASVVGPGVGKGVSQSLGGFGETYSPAALKQFGQKVAKSTYPFVITENLGPWNVSTDEGEGDLDVQYGMAMGQNIETDFWACSEWVLEWSMDVEGSVDPPLVHSLSYGTSIEQQCEIAAHWCNYNGYNSTTYMIRVNEEFMKLGTRGVTILISSGDNGAPGRGNNGHAPLDPSTYCIIGGCAHTTTKCPAVELVMVKDEFKIECVLPLGMSSYGCQLVSSAIGVSDLNGLFEFVQARLPSRAAWEVDNYGNPHLYSPVSCSSISWSGRVDFSDVTLGGFVFNVTEEHLSSSFISEFPGVSPYVLSVGATNIVSLTQAEQCDSLENGGIITSGGGFAIYQPQPSYQQKAVQQYLATLPAAQTPPAVMFDPSHRATPDITFCGERYVTLGALPNGTIVTEVVSGTSASSPALAGLLSLVNAQLLAAGKKPGLGFVNPALYTLFYTTPSAFTDVVAGNNRCTAAYCSLYGWSATKGFDLASGMGSPKFAQLSAYLLSIH